MLSKKFIFAGTILSIGLIGLNAHFVFGSVFPVSLFGLTLPLSERSIVMLMGGGLFGLRWFLPHRKQSDKN